MEKTLITGVDGNFGQLCAKIVMNKISANHLIFTSPNKNALEKYAEKGVDTRYANFNDSRQLTEAFKGAETLLLISMPFVGEKRRAAHKNAIDACVAAGVERLIYTSIVGAGSEECDAYEISDHKYTEKYILEQPLQHIFLRNSQYAEAMVAAYEEAYINTNCVLSNNMGHGKMAYISRDDCAAAAAYAAMGSDGDNIVYNINGAEAMTISKFLEIGGEVTGRKVAYNQITDEQMYEYFDKIGVPRTTDGVWAESAKNFPFCGEGMVTFGKAMRLNQMNSCSKDFEMLTGKKPLTVKEIFMKIERHRIGARTSTDD